MPAQAGTLKAKSQQSEVDDLKQLLDLVRTGSFEKAKQTLIGFGAPKPSDEGQWPERIGSQFFHGGQPPNENLRYIRFITMAAEIYDQFAARRLVDQCLQSHNLQAEIDRDLELIAEPGQQVIQLDTQPEQWHMVRQKLYFWLQVSRVAYRKNDHDYARKHVLRCQNIAQQKLSPTSEGLAADVNFRLAAIAKQQSNLDDAIQFYGKCLACAFDRLKRKQKGTDPLSQVDALATRYLMGKSSALGLGYCFIEKGMLREARMVITMGEMLLWETADQLSLQYCELLFARLLRHSAGRDPNNRESLDAADKILRACVDVCGNHRPRFVYRVYYELGFVELYSGRFTKAEGNFREVLAAAKKGNDLRWVTNGMIAMARLRFYQGQIAATPPAAEALLNKSLGIAIEAERIAKGAKQRWAQARAILMQARAEMSLAMSPSNSEDTQKVLRDSARTNLQRVLQMTELSNPAVRALPLILLARLYRSEGNVPQARSSFEGWLAIKDQVQYAAVRALGEEVRREVFPLKGDFVVSAELPDDALNKEKLVLELERYIFSRLEARRDLTQTERAKIWGGVTCHRTVYDRRLKQVMGSKSVLKENSVQPMAEVTPPNEPRSSSSSGIRMSLVNKSRGCTSVQESAVRGQTRRAEQR